jgi:hypothetical protein
MTERKRPTHTLFVPDEATLVRVLQPLVGGRETFTVEPGPTHTWMLGLFESGLNLVRLELGLGAYREVDWTIGDMRARRDNPN